MNIGEHVQWPYPEVPGTWIGGVITSIENDIVRVVSNSMFASREYIQSLTYLKSLQEHDK
jgi:hypothetical protein